MSTPEDLIKPTTWKEHDELVKRTYPKIKFTNEILNGYKQHIRELGPYHMFFTFVFSQPVSDKLALESISFLIKSVQRKLYPRKNVMNDNCFSGVCIAERHSKSLKKENCFHFHSLIKIDCSVWNHRSIEEIDCAFKDKAKLLRNENLSNDYYIALDDDAVDIQGPYSFGVEMYCVKDLEDVWTGYDAQIGYINSTGVTDFSAISDDKYYYG